MATIETIISSFDDAISTGAPGMQFLVQRALWTLRQQIRAEQVNAALEARTAAMIFQSDAWRTFQANLMNAFNVGEKSPLMRVVNAAARGAVKFSPIDPETFGMEEVLARGALWLERHGPVSATGIDDATRAAMRTMLTQANGRDDAAKRAARYLLRSKSFGLNDRQANALVRLRVQLEEDGFKGRALNRMIQREHKRMLVERAELIAYTEASAAAAVGQRETWAHAVRQGQLDADVWELQWVTRARDVCPRCIALSGTRTTIEAGDFTSRSIVGGGRLDGTAVVLPRPPVHPRCYCALRLVRKRKD